MGGLYDAATLRALVGVAKKEIRTLAAFATTLLPQGGRPGIEPALVWQNTQSFTHAVISAPFTFSQMHDFITSYHLTQ